MRRHMRSFLLLSLLCAIVCGCPPEGPADAAGSGDDSPDQTNTGSQDNSTGGGSGDASDGGSGNGSGDTSGQVGNTPIPVPGGALAVRAGATGAANGRTWTDAFPDLQPAIAAARVPGSNIQQIWVAAGTYKPAGPGGNRATSFPLITDLAMYGGFAGTETQLADRNIAANVTILSGDLNGNDGPNFSNRDDNTKTVLSAFDKQTATAILDGFTISGGFGGGIGSGLLLSGASPTIRNCTFTDNRSDGPGVAFISSSSPLFVACTFRGNQGLGFGGAIYCAGGNVEFRDCLFQENGARLGGAIYLDSGGAFRLTRCTFTGNAALSGGALYNGSTSPNLTNCTFANNKATGNTLPEAGGGAISTFKPIKAVNCVFRQNTTAEDGGAIKAAGMSIALYGCLFDRNQANYAGAVEFGKGGVLLNCTLSGNTATTAGGGVFPIDASWFIRNSILWGNSDSVGPSDMFLGNAPAAASQLSNCDVQSLPMILKGNGNISADPLFVDAANGDLHLQPGSPCIDKGSNAFGVSDYLNDLDGKSRFLGTPPVVDMGAFEQ